MKRSVESADPDPRGAQGGRLGLAPSFWIVVGVALLVRAAYLAQAASAPLFDRLIMDGAVYDSWAREIAAGDWIGKEVFYQAPLYPYLLALLKAFGGDGTWPIRVVQALAGSLSCGFLFLFGADVFSRRVAWISGLCLALYPPAIFFDGIVQKAALGGVLVTLLLWTTARASRSPSRTRWLVAGGVLGLLMMTREETLLLAPVLLGWIVWRERVRPLASCAGLAGAFVAGAALVLLPVAARNAFVGGEFVLTTSQAGSNFYIGNHAGANGTYVPLRPGRSNTPLERIDARELAEIGAGRELSAAEVSSYWFSRSFEWIRAHPGDWLRLIVRKARLLFNRQEIGDSEDQGYYESYSSVLRTLGHVLHLGVVLPLAAVGILAIWRRRDEARLLLLLLATLCAGVVAFYVFARYRYPIVPIAIVLGSVGIEHLLGAWREHAWRRLALLALPLALVAIGANIPVVAGSAQLAGSFSNAGAALLEAGDSAGAATQFRRSLELDDDPDTWLNLGRALARMNRLDEAEDALRHALAARPEDPAYLLEMGRLALARGDAPQALALGRRSVTAWPRDPQAWAFLASIHAQRGEWSRVVAISREALVANPNDVSTGLSLAWLLATAPDARARDAAEAVCIAEDFERRTRGQDFRALDVLAVAYAAAGCFDEAVRRGQEGAQLAERAGQREFAAQIRNRVSLFQGREPLVR